MTDNQSSFLAILDHLPAELNQLLALLSVFHLLQVLLSCLQHLLRVDVRCEPQTQVNTVLNFF